MLPSSCFLLTHFTRYPCMYRLSLFPTSSPRTRSSSRVAESTTAMTMWNPPFSSVFIFLSFFLSLFALAQSSTAQSPSAACEFTLYPKLCRSILSSVPSAPSDPYGYGKYSVKQGLKHALKMSDVIGHFLTHRRLRSSVNYAEVGALDDCRHLSQLNVEYWQTIAAELKSAESLDEERVERVRTLLSAIVTNQQTCYDGLEDSKSSIVSALSEPLNHANQVYSVSLGLVTHALDRNLKLNGKKKASKGGFPTEGRHPARERLETLIKALRKTTCNESRHCTKRERILVDLTEGSGLLINEAVTVGRDGTENFTSITDAIALAPNNSQPGDGYFVIYVREGYYEEYVVVPSYKKNIMLLGDGINRTVITGNHSVKDGLWTTFNSSTFAVSGDRFVAIDVTFRNTAGSEKHQAVALRNNADLSTFYRCSFEAYQDTLYVHSLRQFYRECDIHGTVDFIFGNAAAVFQNCNIYARKPMTTQKNALTAQGRTDPNQNTGISIQNCTIEAAPDLAMNLTSTSTYLGRPWKNYSRTVYMQSYIGSLIHPAGWLEWDGTFATDTLYYGEFENHGPGADTSMRVHWPGYTLMNASDALNFTVDNFTMGQKWLPGTDIPFSAGLLD